jgi:hypothetical protein
MNDAGDVTIPIKFPNRYSWKFYQNNQNYLKICKYLSDSLVKNYTVTDYGSIFHVTFENELDRNLFVLKFNDEITFG